MSAYTISEADWSRQHARLLAVRARVFVDEQGVPEELEFDEHDAQALHLLATDASGDAIGTARLLANGHIGRMAVLPAWRGRGVGSDLLYSMLQLAEQHGLNEVFLHAQCKAIPFYERLGFVPEGEVFDDAGIDHRTMRRRLP